MPPHCTRPAESLRPRRMSPTPRAGKRRSSRSSHPNAGAAAGSRAPAKPPTRMLAPGTYHWTLPVGDLPGRPHRHPPAHRVHSARPARGVATQPRHPATGGATGMSRGVSRSRALLDATALGLTRTDRDHPSSLRDRNHSEHLKQRRTRAGPGGQRRNPRRRANHVPRQQGTQPTADRDVRAEGSRDGRRATSSTTEQDQVPRRRWSRRCHRGPRKHHTITHQTPWQLQIDPQTRRPVWIPPPPKIDVRDQIQLLTPPHHDHPSSPEVCQSSRTDGREDVLGELTVVGPHEDRPVAREYT